MESSKPRRGLPTSPTSPTSPLPRQVLGHHPGLPTSPTSPSSPSPWGRLSAHPFHPGPDDDDIFATSPPIPDPPVEEFEFPEEDPHERPSAGQCRTLQLLRQPELSSLCDIVIKVQGQTFRAHRAVLAAASPVFKSNLSSREKRELELGHTEPEAFAVCLDYMYGKVNVMDGLGEKEAQAVLKCAVSYALLDPLKEVQEFIATNIQVRNVFGYFKYATEYKLDLMYLKCLAVIKRYFEQVVNLPDFLEQKF